MDAILSKSIWKWGFDDSLAKIVYLTKKKVPNSNCDKSNVKENRGIVS